MRMFRQSLCGLALSWRIYSIFFGTLEYRVFIRNNFVECGKRKANDRKYSLTKIEQDQARTKNSKLFSE